MNMRTTNIVSTVLTNVMTTMHVMYNVHEEIEEVADYHIFNLVCSSSCAALALCFFGTFTPLFNVKLTIEFYILSSLPVPTLSICD